MIKYTQALAAATFLFYSTQPGQKITGFASILISHTLIKFTECDAIASTRSLDIKALPGCSADPLSVTGV